MQKKPIKEHKEEVLTRQTGDSNSRTHLSEEQPGNLLKPLSYEIPHPIKCWIIKKRQL